MINAHCVVVMDVVVLMESTKQLPSEQFPYSLVHVDVLAMHSISNDQDKLDIAEINTTSYLAFFLSTTNIITSLTLNNSLNTIKIPFPVEFFIRNTVTDGSTNQSMHANLLLQILSIFQHC